MRITVIGTINKDLILPFKGAPIESLGGIFYTSAILSQLLDSKDEIVPISFIGEDLYETVKAVYGQMPNVNTEALVQIAQKNHKVILEYTSPEDRHEKALFNFPPLEWQHIKKFLDSDFIIVNLITGWDVSFKAFRQISRLGRDRIYLDVHFLVMDIDNLGRRFPYRPVNVENWLKGARFIQMNQREFHTIAGEIKSEVDFFHRFLGANQVLLITCGALGARTIFQKMEMLRSQQVPAFRIPFVVDATGCGDAFGAGFAVEFLKTGNVIKSVRYANLVAAANATLKGTNEMVLLKERMQKIKDVR